MFFELCETLKHILVNVYYKAELKRLKLMAFNARCLNEITKLQFISYSKNPHKKRTSGLRTPRLRFGQQSTTYIRIKSA